MPNEKISFTVTDSHLKLVKRLYFECAWYVDDATHELEIWPAVNPKRPLGNTGVVYDVCSELGWLSEDGSISEDRKTPALLLLAQLPVCLECFARNLELRAGQFELDPHGAWFHYKHAAMAVFWREAIEKCGTLGLDAERAALFTINTPAKKGNPYALLDEMAACFSGPGANRKILDVFEDEAVRRYRTIHGGPCCDRQAVLGMLKSGTAGMESTYAGWPF